MYNIIKTVITTGNFELTSILKKIDTVWIESKITDEEKLELILLAQDKANPQHSMDLIKKVEELDKEIKAIKALLASNDEEADGEEPTEENYEPFVDCKWYYAGDKIAFDGKNYECIAPDGVVCVWSPSAYPTYWKEIE